MKKLFAAFFVLVILVGAFAGTSMAQNNTGDDTQCDAATFVTYIKADANVRIRQSGSLQARILDTAPAGALVPAIAIEANNQWIKVCYAGVEGWTSAAWWSPTSSAEYSLLPIEDTQLPVVAGPADRDGDGLQDNQDYCPDDAGDIFRARPYTGCPHPSALAQCLSLTNTGVCVQKLVDPLVVFGATGQAIAFDCPPYLDAFGNPVVSDNCYIPVFSKIDEGDFEAFLVLGQSGGATVVGYSETINFGLVAGDPATLPRSFRN